MTCQPKTGTEFTANNDTPINGCRIADHQKKSVALYGADHRNECEICFLSLTDHNTNSTLTENIEDYSVSLLKTPVDPATHCNAFVKTKLPQSLEAASTLDESLDSCNTSSPSLLVGEPSLHIALVRNNNTAAKSSHSEVTKTVTGTVTSKSAKPGLYDSSDEQTSLHGSNVYEDPHALQGTLGNFSETNSDRLTAGSPCTETQGNVPVMHPSLTISPGVETEHEEDSLMCIDTVTPVTSNVKEDKAEETLCSADSDCTMILDLCPLESHHLSKTVETLSEIAFCSVGDEGQKQIFSEGLDTHIQGDQDTVLDVTQGCNEKHERNGKVHDCQSRRVNDEMNIKDLGSQVRSLEQKNKINLRKQPLKPLNPPISSRPQSSTRCADIASNSGNVKEHDILCICRCISFHFMQFIAYISNLHLSSFWFSLLILLFLQQVSHKI